MLLIKNGKTIIAHNGTPGTAAKAAERMGLRYFTVLRATPIARYAKTLAGKWSETTPRRIK